MMKNVWTLNKSKALVMSSVFAALIGCSDSTSGNSAPPVSNLPAQSCGGNFTAEQVQQADSLIALGNTLVIDNMENLFNGVENGVWSEAKAGSPAQADSYYTQALTVAPGYCNAQFAQAITATMRIVEDKEVDEIMTKMTNENSGDLSEADTDQLSAFKKVFNIKSEDELPKALLRINSNAETNSSVSSTDIYNLVKDEFYPRLDSTISKLEGVYDQDDFKFEIVIDGKKHQIDKGEIGPLLGGLKILKAFIIAAVARDFSVDLNGSMGWVETVDNIRKEDYDNLSSEQKAALDHLTSMIKGEKGFGNLKPEWKSLYTNIPTLLVGAIDNVVGGLEYGIYESENNGDQQYDLYVVGKGIDADVNPSDLKEGIELLTRIQKYLTGKQTVAWSRGTETLEINVPALFSIDNPLSKLPYFTIRPYSEWNDVVSADTSWYYRPSSFDAKKLAKQLGLEINPDLFSYGFTGASNGDYFLYSVNYDNYEYVELGLFSLTANVCKGEFVSSSVPEGVVEEYTFEACDPTKSEPYVGYIDERTKAPFYFTDASGNLTLDIGDDNDQINSLIDFQGKIVFPDPTFGGIFPGMTNEKMWAKMETLKNVKDRVNYGPEVCDDWGWCEQGTPVLPTNPSDLDFFIYFTSK